MMIDFEGKFLVMVNNFVSMFTYIFLFSIQMFFKHILVFFEYVEKSEKSF